MKKDMGVSPVIAVILMVAITVVLAGVVFLWAQSFTDEAGGDVENVNIKASAYDNDDSAASPATHDYITFEIISGTYDFDDYRVTVDGTTVSVTDTETEYSAGQTVTLDASTETTSELFEPSDSVTIKMVNIAENKVVWEDDVIATTA